MSFELVVESTGGDMAQKKFHDLNLASAFLFAAVMSSEEICRLVLQILLEKPVGSVTVNAEQFLMFSSDCRSIRLDIYAGDAAGNHYNVEMQGENEGNLPQRSRFHQAEMDVLELEPDEDFRMLEPNYVIFICCFDPFGKGLFRYTFTNCCEEVEMRLEDGTMKVFLNTKGRNREAVSEELVNFLKYVENTTDECVEELKDENIRRIHGHVKAIKSSREWRRKYMRFEELLQKEHREGRNEGYESGRADGVLEGREVGEGRMHELVSKMFEAGEGDKIHLLSDKVFLQEMYLKYQI